MVTWSASSVLRRVSTSSSSKPRNAKGSPPPKAISSVPAFARPSRASAALATVHALARSASREQYAQRKLHAFVMPNMTTRGACCRSARVASFASRRWMPVLGWKKSTAPSSGCARKRSMGEG